MNVQLRRQLMVAAAAATLALTPGCQLFKQVAPTIERLARDTACGFVKAQADGLAADFDIPEAFRAAPGDLVQSACSGLVDLVVKQVKSSGTVEKKVEFCVWAHPDDIDGPVGERVETCHDDWVEAMEVVFGAVEAPVHRDTGRTEDYRETRDDGAIIDADGNVIVPAPDG